MATLATNITHSWPPLIRWRADDTVFSALPRAGAFIGLSAACRQFRATRRSHDLLYFFFFLNEPTGIAAASF